MTARRLTQTEAMEFLETAFDQAPDSASIWFVDAVVAGCDVQKAKSDLESFIATISDEIDLASINIKPDQLDDSDLDAVHIIIWTGPQQ